MPPHDILSVTGSDCIVDFPELFRDSGVAVGADEIQLALRINTNEFKNDKDGPPLILLEG